MLPAMPEVAYQDQTVNTQNPIARYAHRARLRRSIRYASELLRVGGCMLDFGCGTGDFLRAFKAVRPDAALLGYEPFLSPGSEAFVRITDMNAVAPGSVDLLGCFEVLEHLTDEQVDRFILDAGRVLRPGGHLLASVPIIGGLTLLLKESNRMLLFRRRSEYGARELLRAAFLGIPGAQPPDRRFSHKGFDFGAMRARLSRRFSLQTESLCPFSPLPWWLNSQAFMVFRAI